FVLRLYAPRQRSNDRNSGQGKYSLVHRILPRVTYCPLADPVASANVPDLARIIRGPCIRKSCINKTYGVIFRLPAERLARFAVVEPVGVEWRFDGNAAHLARLGQVVGHHRVVEWAVHRHVEELLAGPWMVK